MGARFYDARIARFTSPDFGVQVPGWTQGYNKFSYAWNNPYSWVDPTGLANASQCSVSTGACIDLGAFDPIGASPPPQITLPLDIAVPNAATPTSDPLAEYPSGAGSEETGSTEPMPYTPQPGVDQQRISQILQEAATDPQCLRASCGPTQQDIAFQNSSNEYNQPPNEGEIEQQAAAHDESLRLLRSDRPLTEELTAMDIAAMYPPLWPVRGANGAVRAYSVAFEATLTERGIGTYAAHFAEANEQLLKATADPELAAALRETLGANFEGTIVGPGGNVLGRSPTGWTWHHVVDRPGVLQLVPAGQHAPGSAFQALLHPGGVGGMSIWGQRY
jgi:hypothetical protein